MHELKLEGSSKTQIKKLKFTYVIKTDNGNEDSNSIQNSTEILAYCFNSYSCNIQWQGYGVNFTKSFYSVFSIRSAGEIGYLHFYMH